MIDYDRFIDFWHLHSSHGFCTEPRYRFMFRRNICRFGWCVETRRRGPALCPGLRLKLWVINFWQKVEWIWRCLSLKVCQGSFFDSRFRLKLISSTTANVPLDLAFRKDERTWENFEVALARLTNSYAFGLIAIELVLCVFSCTWLWSCLLQISLFWNFLFLLCIWFLLLVSRGLCYLKLH